MSRLEKIDIAREVAASAHDMRRHSRRLQAMLDRIRLLLARPICDRRLELGAIAQPADYRVELCVAQFPTDQSAKRLPMSWIRSVDRDPSILPAARKQTLRHVQWRSGDAAAFWDRAVRGVLVVCGHHELDSRLGLRGIDIACPLPVRDLRWSAARMLATINLGVTASVHGPNGPAGSRSGHPI